MDATIIEHQDHYIVNFHSDKASDWFSFYVDQDLAVINDGSLAIPKHILNFLTYSLDDCGVKYKVMSANNEQNCRPEA